jgi:hypothetical protein
MRIEVGDSSSKDGASCSGYCMNFGAIRMEAQP